MNSLTIYLQVIHTFKLMRRISTAITFKNIYIFPVRLQSDKPYIAGNIILLCIREYLKAGNPALCKWFPAY